MEIAIKAKVKRDAKGKLLPGHGLKSPGRPLGQTMKEFARQYLMSMTDEEKVLFMKNVGDETVWKMAEGNPAQDNTHNVEGKLIIEISKEIATKYDVSTRIAEEGSNG